MRILSVALLALFSLSPFAADITVRVVDPDSATVIGAQVLLIATNNSGTLATASTSAGGAATLRTSFSGPSEIKVLAPGFAAETISVSSAELTVTLRLATAAENVVVSGTRTPVPGEAAGADIDTLSGQQLITMQPV